LRILEFGVWIALSKVLYNKLGVLYALGTGSLTPQASTVIIGAMDIKELTKYMHDFVRAKGWYETDSLRPQTLRNLAISLNLEASEVLEHFQWNEALDDPEGLSDELADVALYLLQIASLSGIDLEQAILQKLKRNYQRTWDEDKLKNGEV
jgi:NTP pyrophosphatase (non-canonical NTP hydrolase)